MMKKFILIVCGSFVGAFLAFLFFMFAAMMMSIGIMGAMGSMGSKKSVNVSKHSILKLDLGTSIEERGGDEPIDMMSLMQGQGLPSSLGLNTVVSAIEKAAKDDKVDGIYIECNGVSAAPATLEKVRRALKQFKKSGKWIAAYGHEGINQADYYLASVADSIYLNPVGAVDLHGLGGMTPYMKKLFDKVGIEMQIVRVGTFKSAVEPYMLDDMSDANRLQTEHYLGIIWNEMRDSIAADRKLQSAALNTLCDSVVVTFKADRLLKEKLVDKLVYRNQMEDILRARTKVDKKDDLNYVSPDDLADDLEASASGDHIAVVYAVGEIDGSPSMGSTEEGIVSDKLCETILKLKDDDNVKGMVFRVNSPGGSAFGSEQIWKAVMDFKAAGKPVAVSMGDYAASGGYYISCCADRIFAERTTITGSIGIFGMIPCASELIENKLGVHMASVKTNENADMTGVYKKLTPAQTAALQNMINEGYELFTKRCADGRHVTQDSIKQIAEGRVWDGITAKQIGLVDEFGGIAEAVAWVANKAKLGKEPKTQNYPALEDPFMSLLDKYMVARYESRLQGEMGLLYDWHKQLQRILGRDRVLCLMPEEKIYF
ncbi:MAG: signal peptide peptidase SppA [Muribaculaceae bacterium]|jgi:protease-4|nr:signal peptide peptidase SppA [Muribaculaceae bacterium]